MVSFTWLEDVGSVKDSVIPPNEEPMTLDDRVDFAKALEFAVYLRDEHKSPLLLQELKKLYPKDVAGSLCAAEETVRTSAGELAPA